MKFLQKIKSVLVLGRRYDYSYVFKNILRKVCLFAQVHKFLKCVFRLRRITLTSDKSVLIMNELTRQFLHQNGKKVLQDIDAVFKEYGIVYWVDAGTLLGIMRDKAFIKHDVDIDIAVLCNDSEHVYRLLKKNAYVSTAYTLDAFHRKTFFRVEKYKVPIDIGFFQVEEKTGCLVHNESFQLSKYMSSQKDNQWEPFQFRFASHVPGDVVRHMFDDVEINIPRKWEDYLDIYYGKDWLIPIGSEEYDRNRKRYLFDKKNTNPYVRFLNESYVHVYPDSPSTITTKLLPWKLKFEVFYYWLTRK